MDKNDSPVPNSEFRIPNSHNPESLSFEQATARLEEIVKLLERGDAPLDKSLELFEEGAKLIKTCGKMLDEAEQIVVRVQKGVNSEPEESLFSEE